MSAVAALDAAVARGADAAVLRRILAAEVALALWSPAPDPQLARALAGLPLAAIDDVDLVLDVEVGAASFAGTLRVAGYPASAAMALSEDCLALAACFAEITGRRRLALRLQVVETDACRKFHADYVAWRLLKTYVGPATQWIRADAPDTINAMATGDVGIFKGRLLHAMPRVLHRSPPIVATGECRLMLVLDTEDLIG